MDTDPSANPPQSEGVSHQQPVIGTTGSAAEDDPLGSSRAVAARIAAGNQSEIASADASPEDSSAAASMAASSSDGSIKPVLTGMDRQIHVFTREAAAAAEASNKYSLSNPTLLSLTAVCCSNPGLMFIVENLYAQSTNPCSFRSSKDICL